MATALAFVRGVVSVFPADALGGARQAAEQIFNLVSDGQTASRKGKLQVLAG